MGNVLRSASIEIRRSPAIVSRAQFVAWRQQEQIEPDAITEALTSARTIRDAPSSQQRPRLVLPGGCRLMIVKPAGRSANETASKRATPARPRLANRRRSGARSGALARAHPPARTGSRLRARSWSVPCRAPARRGEVGLSQLPHLFVELQHEPVVSPVDTMALRVERGDPLDLITQLVDLHNCSVPSTTSGGSGSAARRRRHARVR